VSQRLQLYITAFREAIDEQELVGAIGGESLSRGDGF
jgi:hypothetical protein